MFNLTKLLTFAKSKASATHQDVELWKALRSDEWIVDGRPFMADIVVTPHGRVYAFTNMARRELKAI